MIALALAVVIVLSTFALAVVVPRRREAKRAALRAQEPDPHWVSLLERRIPLIRRLPRATRAELYGHIRVLLAEKRFESCNGLEVTDDHRVIICGLAALLLIGRPVRYFDRLVSILIYPGSFVSKRHTEIEDGLVLHEDEERAGESWQHGLVIISWEELEADLADRSGDRNVVLHEFAHQLDAENGAMDGVPLAHTGDLQARLDVALTTAAESFAQAVERGCATAIDEYAAVEPAEFFAVISETFFMAPLKVKRHDPALYALLAEFYRLDPLTWDGASRTAHT